MARVLVVGIDPDKVDYSDPSVPPGMTADKVRAGIRGGLDGLRAAGHEVDQLYIPEDPNQLDDMVDRLEQGDLDCVGIGGGVRMPPKNLALFEALLNLIAQTDPPPVIALLAGPEDAPAAVARALERSGDTSAVTY